MAITTTPSGGPAGEFSTYTPIYAQTLSSAASSIVLSNIPTTYTDLRLVVSARGTTTAYFAPAIAFNGDTGTNYNWTAAYGDGATAASYRVTGQVVISGEQVSRSSDTSGMFSMVTFDIQSYSNPTLYKNVLVRNSSLASTGVAYMGCGMWKSNAVVTGITLTGGPNFEVGSTVTLYGIKAAATAPKATGGDMVVTDGTYWYHVFKNSGIFQLTSANSSLTADVLTVAGGAGGGGYGGGGGAGGLIPYTSRSFNAAPYSITVGAGGASVPPSTFASGGNGTNSIVNSASATLTAVGGGGGGAWQNDGIAGGSGGGASSHGTGTRVGGSPTSGQGNAGGGAWAGDATHIDAGGGGGYTSAGSTSSSGVGGAGGAGYSLASADQVVIGYTVLASGGGGSSRNSPGNGGTGAGNGSNNGSNAGNGVSYGSGGGGSGQASGGGATGYSGSGAAGIVVVRYGI